MLSTSPNERSIVDRLRKFATRILSSHFFRNVFVVMTGTVLAQGINLAFVPILSRIYSPESFGVFGIYLSLVGIITCFATLRYDSALMLPKDDYDAAAILGLCGIILVLSTIVIEVVFLIFGRSLAMLLNMPELAPWLWLVPVSVVCMSTWLTLVSWATRQKQFHRTSVSQVTRSLASAGSQTTAGLCGAHAFGMILGALLGDICAAVAIAVPIFRRDGSLIRESFSPSRMKRLAREYVDFPLYASPQSLLNTLSINVPMLLLAHYFGPVVVGYYAVGVRIVQLPLNLVTTSLRNVLYQKSNEVYNTGGNTYALFRKTTLGLMSIVVPPTVLIFFFAPMIATFCLGERWYMAGEYSSWMVLWGAVGFCNLPAQQFGRIYRQQHVLLWFEVVLLISRVLAIVIGGTFCTALGTVILFSVVGVAYNASLIAWVWAFLRRHVKTEMANHPAECDSFKRMPM